MVPSVLRAFGSYVIRVTDPGTFIREIVGTDGHFTTDEITDQLRNLIVSRFADIIGESKIPVLDLAANYDELGEFITGKIKDDFANYGLDVTKMLVKNISLPKAVEEALDKRSSMGVIGNLDQYTKFQTANAMEEAAKNPGGMAGGGMGMGMGFAMANQMGQSMTSQPQQPASAMPQTSQFHVAIDGKQSGPLGMSALQQHVQSGKLTRETLVWRQGMTGWTAAGEVGELTNLFGAVPPPLPPQ